LLSAERKQARALKRAMLAVYLFFSFAVLHHRPYLLVISWFSGSSFDDPLESKLSLLVASSHIIVIGCQQRHHCDWLPAATSLRLVASSHIIVIGCQ
jgi:hypothetical protein